MPLFSIYRHLVRPVLFQGDPERVHQHIIRLGRAVDRVPAVSGLIARCMRINEPRLRVNLGELTFDHPLGLAAGFDKNGWAIGTLSALGFGHVEVGSVSAEASSGNPRPRLFRLPEDQAIVVNYGVPNEGAPRVAEHLHDGPRFAPVGVNLVATNTGQPRSAAATIDDYLTSTRILAARADYLAINMSCPNAEGECDFLAPTPHLARLLAGLDECVGRTPVLLKIPAITDRDRLAYLLKHADRARCVAGFSFNLLPGKHAELAPLSRSKDALARMPGAVAGRPCEKYINRSLVTLYALMDRQRYHLIAAGGVFSAEDAYRKIRLGASMVQIYTALVYEGPAVIRRIVRGLPPLLERDGFANISQAVGVDASTLPAKRLSFHA